MVIDDYLVNNVDYVSGFKGLLLMLLSKYIVIVVCMDVWLDVYCMLGIKEGEVYVICNVGCVVIDDVICLLVISQWLLGICEIILLYYIDCGMLIFIDDDFKCVIQDEIGIRFMWLFELYFDVVEDVCQLLCCIEVNLFVIKYMLLCGFVFDVVIGKFNEVMFQQFELLVQGVLVYWQFVEMGLC